MPMKLEDGAGAPTTKSRSTIFGSAARLADEAPAAERLRIFVVCTYLQFCVGFVLIECVREL